MGSIQTVVEKQSRSQGVGLGPTDGYCFSLVGHEKHHRTSAPTLSVVNEEQS
jgi:hypothetical protein